MAIALFIPSNTTNPANTGISAIKPNVSVKNTIYTSAHGAINIKSSVSPTKGGTPNLRRSR